MKQQFTEKRRLPKIGVLFNFENQFLFFAVFSAKTCQKVDFWGCFVIVQISSWWWAYRFWKLMQKWPRKLKLKLILLTQKSFFCLSVTFQIRVEKFNFNFLCQFQNTPKNQLYDEYWPRKHQKTKWHPKSNKTPNFGKLLFSLDCHNLASNQSNSTSWGCFGILKISCWWWAQRFLKLMHPRLRNWWKFLSLISNYPNCKLDRHSACSWLWKHL